jgi:hypothetical protein
VTGPVAATVTTPAATTMATPPAAMASPAATTTAKAAVSRTVGGRREQCGSDETASEKLHLHNNHGLSFFTIA